MFLVLFLLGLLGGNNAEKAWIHKSQHVWEQNVLMCAVTTTKP